MNAIHATDILLIGKDESLLIALQDAGFRVTWVDDNADLYRCVEAYQPAAVLLRADSPSRDTLEHLASFGRRYPQPALLLHDGHDSELSQTALELGISAYVAEGLSAPAMRSLVDVSINHARQVQALRKELARSQKSLAERKLIHTATCVLMEQQGLSEDDAYSQLKTIAMNSRISVFKAAQDLLKEKESL